MSRKKRDDKNPSPDATAELEHPVAAAEGVQADDPGGPTHLPSPANYPSRPADGTEGGDPPIHHGTDATPRRGRTAKPRRAEDAAEDEPQHLQPAEPQAKRWRVSVPKDTTIRAAVVEAETEGDAERVFKRTFGILGSKHPFRVMRTDEPVTPVEGD